MENTDKNYVDTWLDQIMQGIEQEHKERETKAIKNDFKPSGGAASYQTGAPASSQTGDLEFNLSKLACTG